jgi:hypothetical protein
VARRADPARGAELAALIVVQAALVLAFWRVVPLFEAPDEPSHLNYAGFVAWEGRLPGTRGHVDVPGEGMQPPLYYAWLAPWLMALSPPDPALLGELRQISLVTYWQADPRTLTGVTRIRMQPRSEAQRYRVAPELERLRALRLATLPFGLAAVALTFAALLRATGSRPLALMAASLLAFLPQFAFVSSYLNNDAAAAALGAAGLWLFVRCAGRGALARRDYLAAAALFVVGAATKYSTLPALAVTCAALPLIDARPLAARGRDVAAATALGVVALAALAALNVARFGEPTGTAAVFESAAELGAPKHFGGVFAYLTDEYAAWTFQSYWARFGWMNVTAPYAVYLGCFAFLWTGLLGFTLSAWRSAPAEEAAPPVSAVWLRRYLTAVLLATWLTHLWINTRTAAAQGRHLYAAAPHLACALALGVAWLATGRAWRIGWAPALALAGAMLAFSFYCLVAVVAPVYALPWAG